jgi:DNA-binding CsgD family transcriptional regulator
MLFRQLGDRRGAAFVLDAMGNTARRRGEYVEARGLSEQSLTLARDSDDMQMLVSALSSLGHLALHEDEYGRAQVLYEESLTLLRQLGDQPGIAYTISNLGLVAQRRGEHRRAGALFIESLAMFRAIGDNRAIAEGLEFVASLVLVEHPARAARLFGAASVLHELTGFQPEARHRGTREGWLRTTRAKLGRYAFAAAWAQGRGMSRDQAIDDAVAGAEAVLTSVSADGAVVGSAPGELTAREHEVAGLVAQGLSNRQIAERLVVSERTAESHLSHILDKLSLGSRTQVATWAVTHGLVSSDKT